MSFFSSLTVLYPGRPPLLTVGELRAFCGSLRAAFALQDVLLGVDLQYGARDAAAFDATHKVEWNKSGTIGTLPWEENQDGEEWHHHARRKRSWAALWPSPDSAARTVHRAYVGLGGLPREVSRELTAYIPDHPHAYIAPDSLSVSINPAYAETLGAEVRGDADVCYGFFELSFSGNGYFTWQPLEAYWNLVGNNATVRTVLRLCREAFPAPAKEELAPLKQALGTRFLNRDDYESGDWIVSVFETG